MKHLKIRFIEWFAKLIAPGLYTHLHTDGSAMVGIPIEMPMPWAGNEKWAQFYRHQFENAFVVMQRQEVERAGWLGTVRGEFEARFQAQELMIQRLNQTLKEAGAREAKLVKRLKLRGIA